MLRPTGVLRREVRPLGLAHLAERVPSDLHGFREVFLVEPFVPAGRAFGVLRTKSVSDVYGGVWTTVTSLEIKLSWDLGNAGTYLKSLVCKSRAFRRCRIDRRSLPGKTRLCGSTSEGTRVLGCRLLVWKHLHRYPGFLFSCQGSPRNKPSFRLRSSVLFSPVFRVRQTSFRECVRLP